MKLYSNSGKYSSGAAGGSKRPRTVPPVKTNPASAPADPVQAPVSSVTAPKPTPKQQAIRKKRKAKQRRNRRIIIGGILIFLFIMLDVFLFLGIRKLKVVSDFRKLIKEVQQLEENEQSVIPEDVYIPETEPVTEENGETVPAVTEPPVKTILPKYAELYLRNTEFYGWVEIPGTKLNYPVMRSFENNDEYLYANFDGEYSYAGIPFADYKCSHESDNLLIYGHNMKDGTMFRELMKYEKESYWKKHPTIMFSDLYEDYEYEVLAAFYDRVYLKTDTCFKFYQFIDAADEADFDYAISQFKEKSIYDTGVDAQYGDKLITLITCAYHEENGRFVVVARRK